MIQKYGKSIDMRKMNRNMDYISEMIEDNNRLALVSAPETKCSSPQCGVCGSKESSLFAVFLENYEYRKCDKCGCLFLRDIPDVSKLYEDADESYCKIYMDDDIYQNRVDMITKPKIDFVLECIDSATKISSWVDIGCGVGDVLYYLGKRKGIHGVGIEADSKECAFMEQKGLEYINAMVSFDKKSKQVERNISEAQVISFFNVLEHVPYPKKFIDYVSSLMQPGAYMVFEIPRHPSLACFANFTSNGNIYRHICPPGHIYIFSDQSIVSLMGGCLEQVASWQYGQGFMDIVNNAMLISDKKESFLYDMVANANQAIQKTIDETGLADFNLVVARKKG